MLLTRAWWNHLLRSWNRPIGVPEGGALESLARNAKRIPRTPRFVTAFLLLAALAAVLTPGVRQGMQASFDAWLNPGRENAGSAAIARLRKEIGGSHDPQVMALIALLSDDRVERMRMADQAVQLDPSLTWIYGEVPTTDGRGSYYHNPLPPEWIERLRKWDPDNAVPRMLAAQQNWLRFDNDWEKSAERGNYIEQAEQYLGNDPKWLAAMDFALQAPKYDSYYPRKFDLYRTVAQRYDIRDSQMALAILIRPSLLGTLNADIYSEILWDRGDAAQRAGKIPEAIELYSAPVRFAERMAEQSHTDFERREWTGIESRSLRRLQRLLVKTGQAEEATQAGYKLEASQSNLYPFGPVREWAWSENGWEGFMIRLLTAGIFVLGAASLFGMGALFIRRRATVESRGRGLELASLAVDYCPLLLLVACAGLFVAYRPVALMYDQYMNWNSSFPIYDFRGLVHALYTPYESPDGVSTFSYSYLEPYHYWLTAIVGLSIFAAFIVYRGALRRRAAVS